MNRSRQRRRLIELRAQLARAQERDEITGTLCRAAAVFSPRVALFGVKREGLRGLTIPLGISGVADVVTALTASLEAAVAGEQTVTRARDLDLRLAVGIEAAYPCVFAPVRVGDRPVLMLYVDREGDEFDPDERQALAELCQIAGYSLEMLLRSRTVAANDHDTPVSASERTRTDTKGGEPPSIIALAEPIVPPTSRGRVEIDVAERDGPWAEPLSASIAGATMLASESNRRTTAPRESVNARAAMTLTSTAVAAAHVHAHVDEPPPEHAAVSTPDNAPIPAPPPVPEYAPPLASLQLTAAGIDDAITRASRGQLDPDQLLDVGSPMFERIVERFPGELWRPLDSLHDVDLPSAYGPLLRLCVGLGRRFGPHLLTLTKHPDVMTRRLAVLMFQELRDDRCVHALADRVDDDDAITRELAMRVLETYHASSRYTSAIVPIRARLANTNVLTRTRATQALGTLRDVEAIAALIAQLDDHDAALRRTSLAALCSITGQQLGSRRGRWRAWYQDNASRDRVAWLIDTLEYSEPAVRGWAAQELVRVTGRQADPFPVDGDELARAAGVSRWRDWWQRQGGRP